MEPQKEKNNTYTISIFIKKNRMINASYKTTYTSLQWKNKSCFHIHITTKLKS